MKYKRRHGIRRRYMPSRCNVKECPERYRCLDVDTPTRCATFRVWNSGRQILKGDYHE